MNGSVVESIQSIVTILIGIAVAVVILYVAFKLIEPVWNASKNWIILIAFVLLVYFFTFHLVIGAAWLFCPSSLDIALYPDTHDSQIDLSTVSIEGTYVETSDSYVMKPNLPFSLPVVPKIDIERTDPNNPNNVSISCFSFKKIGDKIYVPKPHSPGEGSNVIYETINVFKFVPDKG
jgi:hypothetical protein